MKTRYRTLACALMMVCSSVMSAEAFSTELLVGCYTSGTCKGVTRYTFDTASGRIQTPALETIATDNPSWLAPTADGRRLFLVNENGADAKDPVGRASSFDLGAGAAKSQLLSRANTLGEDPAHASLSADGRYLFVANYTGTLAVIPVDTQGRLQPTTQVTTHRASQADPGRQMAPHAHAAVSSPDGRYVFAVDLGADKIYSYRYDPARSAERPLRPAATPYAELPPGSGPRHLVFDAAGKHAYLTLEMTGQVVALDYADGKFTVVQTLDLLPGTKTGAAGAIHLSSDGRFLYATNRGPDNHLVAYSVNASTGRLTPLQRRSVEGDSPREFAIAPDGRFVVIANQRAQRVVVIERDPTTGKLGKTVQTLDTGLPSDVKFVQR